MWDYLFDSNPNRREGRRELSWGKQRERSVMDRVREPEREEDHVGGTH